MQAKHEGFKVTEVFLKQSNKEFQQFLATIENFAVLLHETSREMSIVNIHRLCKLCKLLCKIALRMENIPQTFAAPKPHSCGLFTNVDYKWGNP